MKKKKVESKKSVQIGDKTEEHISLIERVRRESEEVHTGIGTKKEIARMAFALWLTIPVRYRGAPDGVVEALGIDDPDILELIKIKNVEAFKATCLVSHQAMATWRKEIMGSEQGFDHRAFFRGLMNSGLSALYRKLLEQGDAERFKTFAGYVEGWMPGINLQHSGSIDTLDEDERKALDKLLKKNSVKV